MTKHSELPWRVEYLDKAENSVRAIITRIDRVSKSVYKYALAYILESDIGTDEAKANAYYIVRACNSYDNLLAACKYALTDERPERIKDILIDAIKLAERKEETKDDRDEF